MRVLLSVLLLHVLVRAATTSEHCNLTLPWRVDHVDHMELTEEQYEKLLRCPENLNGCSEDLVSCSFNNYLLMCSCADNCVSYGDCCWEKLSKDMYSKPRLTCRNFNTADGYKHLYTVSGCRDTWPQDDVRDSCENQEAYGDVFYETPVTSLKGVTYFNGYCALCNYDLANVTFWNVSCDSFDNQTCFHGDRAVKVTIPGVVLRSSYSHLRHCSAFLDLIDTCSDTTNQAVSRKCESYFAPVHKSSNRSSPAYKNVYCALCNGEDLSDLECSPPYKVANYSFRLYAMRDFFRGPNLVQIFHPVSSRDDCLFWQNNKCFIPRAGYRYRNDSTTGNGTAANTTAAELISTSQTIQVYFTILCLSVSLICLILKVAVYVIFPEARNFSPTCTLCLSCTLFCSHLLFLLVNSFPLQRVLCMLSAMFLHFGFLSAFFWTTVLSCDMWKGLVTRRVSAGRRRGRSFILYCSIAWVLPLCLVSGCAAIDYAAPSFLLAPRYGQSTCWISSVRGHAVMFLAPIAILLLLNAVLYVHIVIHIHRTKSLAAGFDFRGAGQQSYMKLYVKLAFIMGATWILGFACVYIGSVVTDVLFIVLVGLQGVYLFLGFKDYRWLVDAARAKKGKQEISNVSGNVRLSEMEPAEKTEGVFHKIM